MIRIKGNEIRNFLQKHGIAYKESDYQGGKKLVLEKCAFNENHTGTEAAIIIYPDDSAQYVCQHFSCKGKKIADFIKHFDPNYFKDKKFPQKIQKPTKGTKPAAVLSSDVVPLSSITPVPTEWLIPGWIPKGTLTIVGADGGTGKTAVVCNIVAALVTGKRSILEEMEGENPFAGREPIKVMFFSSEDSFSHVLVERLTNCGADLSNIVTIPASDERFREIRYDSEFLEQLIAVHRPGLVVFDPLQGFIDGAVHMGERNAMRQCLGPLLALGDKYGVTSLIVMHTNKQAGASGRKRFADSSDIYDLARSAIELGICVNEIGFSGQKLRYISHAKSNYGALQKSVLFDIPEGVAKFAGTTTMTARDFILQEMRIPKEEKSNSLRDDVKNEILEQLEDGEKPVNDIDDFLKALGHSNATIRRAKEELKKNGKIRIYGTGYGNEKKFFIKPL